MLQKMKVPKDFKKCARTWLSFDYVFDTVALEQSDYVWESDEKSMFGFGPLEKRIKKSEMEKSLGPYEFVVVP
jgi:hypothetical protein